MHRVKKGDENEATLAKVAMQLLDRRTMYATRGSNEVRGAFKLLQ